MCEAEKGPNDRRIQLWFEEHRLRAYRAKPSAADEYAKAIGRRFPGLKITIDSDINADLRPLPCEQLWGVLTP